VPGAIELVSYGASAEICRALVRSAALVLGMRYQVTAEQPADEMRINCMWRLTALEF